MTAKKRLIDANILFRAINRIRCPQGATMNDGLADACQAVMDAPTVDAVEVVHGWWEQIGYDKAMDRISCSCCKEYWNILDNDTETFNYCPNCGAKMDGERSSE